MANLKNDSVKNAHIAKDRNMKLKGAMEEENHPESATIQFMHEPYKTLPRVEFGACKGCGMRIPRAKRFCGACSLKVLDKKRRR